MHFGMHVCVPIHFLLEVDTGMLATCPACTCLLPSLFSRQTHFPSAEIVGRTPYTVRLTRGMSMYVQNKTAFVPLWVMDNWSSNTLHTLLRVCDSSPSLLCNICCTCNVYICPPYASQSARELVAHKLFDAFVLRASVRLWLGVQSHLSIMGTRNTQNNTSVMPCICLFVVLGSQEACLYAVLAASIMRSSDSTEIADLINTIRQNIQRRLDRKRKCSDSQ
ncbi:hypothetical protein DUNSADRAFT_13184 [Dunaliella salina]|uniref:Uncharacterized protein n=1 Tax=Dunaliella salina TaxID=3046 RepID=A0ABQ7G9X1_DUNSA|nr:hypothetical protein DUNSADRAFT_13184 [Dunaliella salina]|eukprot:KAF5831394.1 hypothetical protein DUNSADRAFT_13184 [Dunaliella salina]